MEKDYGFYYVTCSPKDVSSDILYKRDETTIYKKKEVHYSPHCFISGIDYSLLVY